MKYYNCFNTKEKKFFSYAEYEVERCFGCDSFYDRFGFVDEQELSKEQYLIEMIQYDVWTSPKGIKNEFEVMSVINNVSLPFGATIKSLLTDYISNDYVDFEAFGSNEEKIKTLFAEYDREFNSIPCEEDGFSFEQQKIADELEYEYVKKVEELL